MHRGIGADLVMELCTPYYRSGRNIVTDNYFTSHALAVSLLQHNLTLLGTVKSNRREIPQSLRNIKGREILSSKFIFDLQNNITIVSFIPKKSKNVLLLSSSHFDAEISDVGSKPQMILDYNHTKSGVDVMDGRIEHFTCRRKINRWPCLIFFNLLDIANLNGFLLFQKQGYNHSRKHFIKELARQLAFDHMQSRMQFKNLSFSIRYAANLLGIIAPPQPIIPTANSQPRKCLLCPPRNKKSTRQVCESCKRSVCSDHAITSKKVTCNDCHQ